MRNEGHHTGNLAELRTKAARAPMLSAENETRLAREAQAGDSAALDTLVRSHLRLVLSIASSFRHHNVDMEDLVGEGLLGLVEAVRRFDAERGVRLAAYAAWWIRAYVRRYTLVNRRIVRPPSTRNARKLLAHLRTTQRSLTQQHGHPPEASEVANALNVSTSDVEEMEDVLRAADVSWSVGPEGGVRELPASTPTPEAALIADNERAWATTTIAAAVEGLSPREREVFIERSLQDAPPSLSTMGARMGISRERVRQIHAHGFNKVRDAVLASVA
jgi:RNA polymerase sigma-32 factor